MENMDIDMVFDIPDTPDRIKARLREAAGRESSSYARNFCFIDEDHSNKMGNSEKTMRHHNYDHTSSNGDFEKRNGLRPSGKAPLFRRTAVEKDKGKAISSKFPSKVSAQIDPAKNYNQEDMHKVFCKKGYPLDATKSLSISVAQLDGKADKGKEKIDDDTETEKERIILSSPPPHKRDNRILSFDQPAIPAAGRRRLVRNRFISPHGIAANTKQLAEHNQFSSKDDHLERHLTRKDASNNPSPVDIQDIVMEVNASDGAKGKRAITHHHVSKDDEVQIINIEETRNGRRETSGSGGWRSTHSRQTRIGHSLPVRNKVSSRGLAPTTSSCSAETEPKSEHSQADKIVIKRGRNSGFASAAPDEPEISVFGSSLESSRLRSSDFQNYQSRAMLHHVLQTDDSFSDVCPSGVDSSGSSHNDESEARARQLEADERLARELQMQLDQDAAIFDNDEIDENIAWALQQEESSLQASSSLNHRPHHRSSCRQTRPQLQQNSSNTRTNIPQASLPARMTRSRGNPFGRSPAGVLRNWNFRFPTEMDIDSRFDMLEELEAAVDELSGSMDRTNRLLQSGSDFSRISRLLQFDGDFSEQDYEMLLALDEDNHRHGGASVNQVNNLPQSTVQTDNFEEACAICLETPAKGDVIRHLPCLHKFHKDCIDPWLGRSKSCPVCKSSIS